MNLKPLKKFYAKCDDLCILYKIHSARKYDDDLSFILYEFQAIKDINGKELPQCVQYISFGAVIKDGEAKIDDALLGVNYLFPMGDYKMGLSTYGKYSTVRASHKSFKYLKGAKTDEEARLLAEIL